MAHQEPQNTLQQDLFLLAKGHYQSDTWPFVELAKRICAFHVLTAWSTFKLCDAAYWMMKEFVQTDIILKDKEKLCRFMLEHGKYHQLGLLTPFTLPTDMPYHEQYFRILIEDLLAEVRQLQVIENDEWLMPFPKPEVDPFLVQLFNEKAPTEA